MSNGDPRRLRVLVCGTTFGQVYLEALKSGREKFELAGILALGSERSRLCASFYQVPLFTSVEQVPADIDIACVVVRSCLLGGRGSDLVSHFLQRGIHVLQEHPVHHDEIAGFLRLARTSRVQYQLNTFYRHLEPVGNFLGAAQMLLLRHKPLYVDAACSFQVCHALFDILRLALGKTRPWRFVAAPALEPASGGEVPFRSVDGVFAGVPLSLRIQHQMDPSNPDDYIHLLHRITLGTDAGELTLVTTHGPLIWCARPVIPIEVRDPRAKLLFGSVSSGNDTCTAVLGRAEEPSQRYLFQTMWPNAVLGALLELANFITENTDPLPRGQHQLTLCRVWQDLTEALGPPRLTRNSIQPQPLSVAEVAALRGRRPQT